MIRLQYQGANSWFFCVILDAKYYKQSLKKYVCLYRITKSVARTTVKGAADVADSTADLLLSQMKAAEPFTEKEKSDLKILDTTQPQEAQLKQLISQ